MKLKRKITPAGPYILVQKLPTVRKIGTVLVPETVTDENEAERGTVATILAVGSGPFIPERGDFAEESPFEPGWTVLCTSRGGYRWPPELVAGADADGGECRLVSISDVVAVLTEPEEEEEE